MEVGESRKMKATRIMALGLVVFAVFGALAFAFATSAVSATDTTGVSSATDTLNALLPTIIGLMVIVMVISLISGIFAGMKFGGGRK